MEENYDYAPFDPEAEAAAAQRTRQEDIAAREQAARFQLLPSWANPDTDMPLGRDEETGYPRYQGVGGRVYLWPELDNVEAVERRPATEVARQVYEAIPPMENWRLPTMSSLSSKMSLDLI